MRSGDVVAGRYEIERLAGSGGMGRVYRALDRQGGKVALKVVEGQDPDRAERFLREARVLAELAHPGIVRYVDHGRLPEGDLFMAMEWLEGEDLSGRMERQGLSIDEAVELIRRAAGALAVAHARGIIHRDIKPSNLFLA